MNITSIISEYNPLHNGHLYHIKKTKKLTNSDAIICIMSGNYVQRGLPAMIDKWNRSKIALECGADLVIELPVLYSLSSAEFFAFGAVSLLNSLGVVNSICFGSESGDIEHLNYIARILHGEPIEFKRSLKNYLSLGYAYPAARSIALNDYINYLNSNINIDFKESLSTSNNILGIEYCKSLIKLNSNIKPYTLKREGASYNSENIHSIFSSATAIRKYIKENNDISELRNHMPFQSYDLIIELKNNNYDFANEDNMMKYLRYKHFCTNSSIENLPDVSEGLHNKIYKNIDKSTNYSDLIENIKSKRFTYTRINRILCQYFIGFEKYDTRILRKEPCPYARVLGFNEMGTKILKEMKSNSSIPVYTKLPKISTEVLDLDIEATKAYSLLNSNISPLSDYLISPIRL
jgi:predicted nucleotidyltransferase